MIPRVCVVSALYHPDLGGLGRQAQLLSERLREEGVELFVIARKMKIEGTSTFSPNVEVVRVPSLFPKHHILEEISLKNVLISVVFSLGCLGVLIQRRKSYDLVHFHGASIPLFVALPFLKCMGKKVVAKVAAANLGTEAGSLSGKYWIIGTLLTRMVRKVDAYVAISQEIREGLLSDGVPPGRIHRIDNFVDLSLFHPPAEGERDCLKRKLGFTGNLLVLYSGRLVPRKGLEDLLGAWKEVVEDFPDARLVVLGDGPLLSSLKRLAATAGVSETVCFIGRVVNVQEILRAGDIFTLPSLQEGMPNALLEAMACGLPVVATRIGGVTDVIKDGKEGILVPPSHPAGIQAALRKILSNAVLRESFGSNAVRTILDRYGLESRLESYKSLYMTISREGSK
jgi:glycosyltransferase involved in cell wall biosynthesis